MRTIQLILITAILSSLLAGTAAAKRLTCPPDSVPVGTVCIDKYEASVWRIPAEKTSLINKAKRGKATAQDLLAAGATQLCSIPPGNNTCLSCTYGPTFPVTGNWTEPVYALSIPGVFPSSCLTWFQAEQACRLSDKRLVTNQEWQAAAAGTPDPGNDDDKTTTCNTNSEEASKAGARPACVSAWGAYDMVGNVWEWVGTWLDVGNGACTNFDATYGDDMSCVGPNGVVPMPTPEPPSVALPGTETRPRPADIFPVSPAFPGAIIRGGNFAAGTRNGVFAIFSGAPPHNTSRSTGFRCAR